MNEVNGTRITFKRTRPNPLFQSWLEELRDEASSKKSKLEPILKEALNSLSKYPLPLQTGAECAILTGFDRRLCSFLDKRLEVYAINNQSKIKAKPNQKSCSNEEPAFSTYLNNPNKEPEVPANSDKIEPLKNPKTKQYKPAHRSGGYAILLGLLESSETRMNKSINKNDLIEIAQKYSEESFVRPKPGTFYTSWSHMAKLVTKKLVEKHGGKKATYSLSEQGRILASKLLEETNQIPSVNDEIFNDNNIIGNSFKSPEETNSIASNKESIEHKIDIQHTSNPIDSATTTAISSKHCHSETVVNEMKPGTFDIILLIDKNETGGLSKKNEPTVAQFQKFSDLKHEYRSLKVGDFTWIARDKVKGTEFVLPYIVERKRMDDLGASIKDGRFHEQKFRLRKCGLKTVIYMVESYGSNKHVGLPVQSLLQALANTRVQDGFKVHMTNSLTNSVRFLAMLTKRLTIEYKDKNLKGHNHEPTNDTFMTFDFFNKFSVKNKALTVTDTFIKLLLQLKGMSVEKALAITNTYNTPSALFKAYENCSKKEGELLLANLKYNNVSRNVGPTISKSIYQLFTFVNV